MMLSFHPRDLEELTQAAVRGAVDYRTGLPAAANPFEDCTVSGRADRDLAELAWAWMVGWREAQWLKMRRAIS